MPKERLKTDKDSKRKNALDFIGCKFGKLTLLSVTDKIKDNKKICVFGCECGNAVELVGSRVLCGKTTHCGCVKPEHKPEDLNGQQYGYLTFRDFAYIKNNKSYYNVECICGTKKQVQSHNVKSGKIKSCGCKKGELSGEKMRSSHIGERYSWLTITRFSHAKSNNTYFFCLCDCGKEAINTRSDLVLGRIKSCGCKRSELLRDLNTLPDNMGSINVLFGQYSSKAKKSKREFTLTLDEFICLLGGDCHYCSSPPSNKYRHRKTSQQYFMYNGIDRIDSSKGYTIDNVVSCCKVCNVAKLDQTQHQFKSWIRRVFYNYAVPDKLKDQSKYSGLLADLVWSEQ